MIDRWLVAVCRKEGLQADALETLAGGHINHMFRNDGCILRAARSVDDNLRLRQEGELLQFLHAQTGGKLLAPEILSMGEHEGRFYQVQRAIHGDMLHRLWPQYSMVQKERIMMQLGDQLAYLHGIACSTIGWRHTPEITYPTWAGYVETQYRKALEGLEQSSTGISSALLAAARQFLDERLPLLEGGDPVLVHADLWPGNILVDGDTVTGILDFEFTFQAPRDYELVLIEDFCLYPNDFIEHDLKKRSIPDYSDFFTLLRRYAPGLFAVPHLRERVDLYHVLFNLQLYQGWRAGNPEAVESGYLVAKLARITNMLFGHGVRMFA